MDCSNETVLKTVMGLTRTKLASEAIRVADLLKAAEERNAFIALANDGGGIQHNDRTALLLFPKLPWSSETKMAFLPFA